MIQRRLQLRLAASVAAVLVAVAGFSAQADAQACREQTVIMLSASWCGYCRQARTFFNAHDIAFTEIDVEKTDHADIRRLYRENGVPVIFIGREQVSGFDEPRLRELLCVED